MKTYVERFEAWHATSMMDVQELVGGAPVIKQVHAVWLQDNTNAHSLLTSEGDVLACGGTIPQWPGRQVAWMSFSKGAGDHMLLLTRMIKAMLKTLPGRTEMTVIKDFEIGHRWAKLLGFKVETPTLEAYGLAGEDHTGYVYINEV